MNRAAQPTPSLALEPPWTKGRFWKRQGLRDMEYVPRKGWNATLSALAYAAYRERCLREHRSPDLNLWAAMHALPASGRYAQLGADALVLWHGTSAARAEKIREHGLIHREGVWAATDPSIAHGYTRWRSTSFQAGSAMIVFVISKTAWDARATRWGDNIAQFHRSIPADQIEYILWSDGLEFVGTARAREPRPWGIARFTRREGQWTPCCHRPVRFDAEHTYEELAEWLELSVRRIFQVLGTASTIEVFSSLYACLRPFEALDNQCVLEALDDLCCPAKGTHGRVRQFRLKDALSDG